VAGLTFNNNRLLIHRLKADYFYSLPGGRVEFMENTENTLIREMKEELNIDVEIKQLLWIGEHFFELYGVRYHEICYYYLMDSDDINLKVNESVFEIVENNRIFEFKWVQVCELNKEVFYPIFIKERVNNLPKSIEKFVEIDNDSYDEWFRN